MKTKISIDLVIPTHNRSRSGLLQRTLTSLVKLQTNDEIDVQAYIVANACNDNSKEVVEYFQKISPIPILYFEEYVPGKSYALNLGISKGLGEWIAFFDDDEIISTDWLIEFSKKRDEKEFDFCAGHHIADFEVLPPEWLPPSNSISIIACHDEKIQQQPLSLEDAIFWGGNCVVKRSAINTVGEFDNILGRSGIRKALGCEDFDMQHRLLKAGFSGWYFPTLRILHWVPESRLNKKYFRYWMFWSGYSARQFYFLKEYEKSHDKLWFGIPRWNYKNILKAIYAHLDNCITLSESKNIFDSELKLRWYLGYFLARYDEFNNKKNIR
ncbi:MAG: glycosyltransferase family 2 protein [Bacteriovorax sp.]|nr:glycosyltransferase family 2 protein [Bacteriovorax sp.]